MSFITHIEGEKFELNRAVEAIKKGEAPLLINNICKGEEIHLICYAHKNLHLPILYIAKDDFEGNAYHAQLSALMGEGVYYYPARDIVYYNIEGRNYDWEHKRTQTLMAIKEGKAKVIVTTLQAVSQILPPKEEFYKKVSCLKVGQTIRIEDLTRTLVDSGYSAAQTIEGVGQFARRGYILDVFPPNGENPIRIEFFDDDIDTISEFDLHTQRRLDGVDSTTIPPVKEQVILQNSKVEELFGNLLKRAKLIKRENKEDIECEIAADLEKFKVSGELLCFDRYMPLLFEPSSIFDYLDKETLVFFTNYKGLSSAFNDIAFVLNEDIKQLLQKTLPYPQSAKFYLDFTDIIARAQKFPLIIGDNFNNFVGDIPLKQMITSKSRNLAPFTTMEFLQDEMGFYKEKGYTVAICTQTRDKGERISKILLEQGIIAPVRENSDDLKVGEIFVLITPMKYGVEYETAKLAILCEKTVAEGTKKKISQKGKDKKRKTLFYGDLKPGDYVVHVNYGIGRFVGIEKIEVEKTAKDYVKIAYAGRDTLFIPCNQLDLISKYIAPEHAKVKLSKMHTTDWAKAKQKVKESVRTMAKELIILYGERQKIVGYPFPKDDYLQADFEAKFPYEETDDQLRSSSEIKGDMEKTSPMDRLLCGDVGFGKTEVAMRAIFKCVNGGKQAAVLVPTTLLAMQHYTTMLERFEGYPIKIQVLSRFRTKKQMEEILRDVKRGDIDIVIGTHRIIQKDVKFKDLGLLVVDEEQRFGVLHKEKLKEMTKNVHSLTLSATPIPRTLNMAMSGIRDMSLIEEAPSGRHPVTTYVCAYNDGIVADAIAKEIRRGGQVFYLFNNVENIELEAAKISRLVPNARVLFAHGKMSEGELSGVMAKFIGGEGDVLVCTTIIETGIDIPNANTLIIPNSDRLGLSQLYQIRGRVGRSVKRACAYLMYNGNKVLSEDATKRLMAIKEYTEFGSGFKIAMRDLQIRGAGNILGTSQSGHMESVGYDMYVKLLNEAVLEEKGEGKNIPQSCAVDILIDAFIPQKYIESGETRIEIYKKISAVADGDDASDVVDELIDRFGDVPKCVMNLIDIAQLRNSATALNIREITQKGNKIFVYPNEMTVESICNLTRVFNKEITFLSGSADGFCIENKNKTDNMLLIKKVIEAFLTP